MTGALEQREEASVTEAGQVQEGAEGHETREVIGRRPGHGEQGRVLSRRTDMI